MTESELFEPFCRLAVEASLELRKVDLRKALIEFGQIVPFQFVVKVVAVSLNRSDRKHQSLGTGLVGEAVRQELQNGSSRLFGKR